MDFAAATSATIDGLEREADQELSGLDSLEEAAQRFCEILQATFAQSVVLVRVFATVPFADLPESSRTFVRTLAGGRQTLAPQTPVLSLLGTRGVVPRWNGRLLSEGHLAIPLASAEFIDAIPMIASLVRQLGLPLAGTSDLDTAIVTQSLGRAAAVFYVDDARTAVDSQGRHIIAARDFVEQHDVRTVFGFGGAYALTGTFVVTVIFTRESVARSQAERFMRLVNQLKASTMRAVGRRRIFA